MSRASRRLLLMMASRGFVPADIPQAEADALIWLYNNTAGASWTDNTDWLTDRTVGNWYGVTVAGGHVTQVLLQSNNLSGNVAAFAIDDLPSLTHVYFYSNASVSGDISGWSLPSTLTNLRVYSSGISGDLSTLVLPSGLERLYANSTSITAGADASGALALKDYRIQDCSLSQAAVDAIVQEIYDNWAGYTDPAPALNVGGSNSAPSGTYQDGDPPTTGKEYIYEIVNDPEATGNETWTVTYTA